MKIAIRAFPDDGYMEFSWSKLFLDESDDLFPHCATGRVDRCKLVQLSMWTLAPAPNSASWKVAAEKRFNSPISWRPRGPIAKNVLKSLFGDDPWQKYAWERNDSELIETQVPGSSAYFVRPNMVPVATRMNHRLGVVFLKLFSPKTATDILWIYGIYAYLIICNYI